jgi:hypothetical protein
VLLSLKKSCEAVAGWEREANALKKADAIWLPPWPSCTTTHPMLAICRQPAAISLPLIQFSKLAVQGLALVHTLLKNYCAGTSPCFPLSLHRGRNNTVTHSTDFALLRYHCWTRIFLSDRQW